MVPPHTGATSELRASTIKLCGASCAQFAPTVNGSVMQVRTSDRQKCS